MKILFLILAMTSARVYADGFPQCPTKTDDPKIAKQMFTKILGVSSYNLSSPDGSMHAALIAGKDLEFALSKDLIAGAKLSGSIHAAVCQSGKSTIIASNANGNGKSYTISRAGAGLIKAWGPMLDSEGQAFSAR